MVGENFKREEVEVGRGQAVIVVALRGVLRDNLYVDMYFLGRSRLKSLGVQALVCAHSSS